MCITPPLQSTVNYSLYLHYLVVESFLLWFSLPVMNLSSINTHFSFICSSIVCFLPMVSNLYICTTKLFIANRVFSLISITGPLSFVFFTVCSFLNLFCFESIKSASLEKTLFYYFSCYIHCCFSFFVYIYIYKVVNCVTENIILIILFQVF